jgi:hypothetical protein
MAAGRPQEREGIEMKRRPPEHVAEPRPEPLPPLDHYRRAGVDQARLYRFLLKEALLRLRAARRLERSRSICYPETGVCLRDAERISAKLNSLIGQPPAGDDGMKQLLDDL